MKFTIGQRVRFYVSREFLKGQGITNNTNTGWITGKVTKIYSPGYDKPVSVSLDHETNVLSAYVSSLDFTEKGHYYTNTEVIGAAEQLTLQPLTLLKRRHL